MTQLSNQHAEEFDLPAFLLGEIYNRMDAEDQQLWNRDEAEALAADLKRDGIEAGAEEVFEIISAFIAQDAAD